MGLQATTCKVPDIGFLTMFDSLYLDTSLLLLKSKWKIIIYSELYVGKVRLEFMSELTYVKPIPCHKVLAWRVHVNDVCLFNSFFVSWCCAIRMHVIPSLCTYFDDWSAIKCVSSLCYYCLLESCITCWLVLCSVISLPREVGIRGTSTWSTNSYAQKEPLPCDNMGKHH